jgi:hypothetical protein
MATYDIYNPPVGSELLDGIKEFSDKEVWGFCLYIIDHPDITYKEMSEDLNIPIPELVRIHKKCYSCRQYIKRPCDIGDYENTHLQMWEHSKILMEMIFDSFYPITDNVKYICGLYDRMTPYYDEDAGEICIC